MRKFEQIFVSFLCLCWFIYPSSSTFSVPSFLPSQSSFCCILILFFIIITTMDHPCCKWSGKTKVFHDFKAFYSLLPLTYLRVDERVEELGDRENRFTICQSHQILSPFSSFSLIFFLSITNFEYLLLIAETFQYLKFKFRLSFHHLSIKFFPLAVCKFSLIFCAKLDRKLNFLSFIS